MKRFRAAAAVLEAVLLLFLFTGCWDYREVESLTLVAGIAVDRGHDGYKYHLSFECIQISGDQKQATSQPWIVETDGDTVFDAVRGALKISQKRLYFAPCRVVVLSEDIAKEGIKPVLDWFLRDAEPRITIEFLVSRGTTAGEILKQEPQPGERLSYEISDLLGGATAFSGNVTAERLYEINNILNSEGTSLVLPGVRVSDTVGDSKLELSGTAVFKGDRQIGWLEDEQGKYLNVILNRLKGGLIITGDSPEDKNYSLEILASSTKVEPVVENGSVTMKIDVYTEVALGERNSGESPGGEDILKIQSDAEKTLQKGIGDLISQVQAKYDSDIFGFGGAIYHKDPDEWGKLKASWDAKFRTLKYVANATVEIRNTALITVQGKGGG